MPEEAVQAAETANEAEGVADEKNEETVAAAEAPPAAEAPAEVQPEAPIEAKAEAPAEADAPVEAKTEAPAEAAPVGEPVTPEDVSYQAVEKEGTVTAIWEMQGQKHLRTIDPRSIEGKQILQLFETAG